MLDAELTFKETVKLFLVVVSHLTFPPAVSNVLHNHQHLVQPEFSIFAILIGV